MREAAAQHHDGVVMIQTAEGLAAERAPFSVESPTLDPGGALAALTVSYARPHADLDGDADDMIVVTDVFSNGVASLADVVQPPRDRRRLHAPAIPRGRGRLFLFRLVDDQGLGREQHARDRGGVR